MHHESAVNAVYNFYITSCWLLYNSPWSW